LIWSESSEATVALLKGDSGAPWLPLLTARLFALEAEDVETEAPEGDCEMRGDTAIFGDVQAGSVKEIECRSFYHISKSHNRKETHDDLRSSLMREVRCHIE
jgi:hypothetical protein